MNPDYLNSKPASYGKGGVGAMISFALARCELGILLVARTSTGVCAVRLGEEESALEASLREEFFAATISRDDGALQAEIEAVLRVLHGFEPNFSLPLDVAATAWQARV
ncbi:MAG TPA: hypothetical protein VF627_01735, partial [Abditibacterium sp.]